ncbi:MAG: hypothetical protein NVV59_01440 [Chitinophagaceae bacterium]|nr:hypothetical protein [Chitinophagaceae bacterium]
MPRKTPTLFSNSPYPWSFLKNQMSYFIFKSDVRGGLAMALTGCKEEAAAATEAQHERKIAEVRDG